MQERRKEAKMIFPADLSLQLPNDPVNVNINLLKRQEYEVIDLSAKLLNAIMEVRVKLALFCLLLPGLVWCLQDERKSHGNRITARISDQVPRQFCHQIIENLQNVLTSTSRQLHTSTDGRGHFENVDIVLPASWAANDCARNASVDDKHFLLGTTASFDFDVIVPDRVFGSEPVALQWGQCGSKGQGVNVPFTLLTQANSIRKYTELRVFQEWVRHRYGVYPEAGFPDDPMYPDTKEIPGQNATSEAINAGCNNLVDFIRDDRQIENMSREFVPLCNPDVYNRKARTKQNLLCDRKSAQEIILANEDFARENNGNLDRRDEETDQNTTLRIADIFRFNDLDPWRPKFRLKLPNSPLRLILVIDVSQRMNQNQGQWTRTRDSIFRLISHMPIGSEFGLVTFDTSAKIVTDPIMVKSSNKGGIFGKVPHRLSSDRQGCLLCAMEVAISLVNESPGVILVISASPLLPLNSQGLGSRIQKLRSDIRTNKTPVYHIFFNEYIVQPRKIMEFGQQFSMSTSTDLLQDLSKIFLKILGDVGGPRVSQCFKETLIWKGSMMSGTFRIEENLNSNLWFVLTARFKEDVESFEVISPSGIKLDFPQFDNGIVFFYLDGTREPGIWSYKVRLHPTVQTGAEVVLEVFGENTKVISAINIDSWNNVPLVGNDSPDENPVIIYARVTHDRVPIQRARVVAKVYVPNRSGSEKFVEILLKDSGDGYPDITSGDGVYSGYLTEFGPEPGFYNVDIEVSDNGGKAEVPEVFGGLQCCGSVIPSSFKVPTHSFRRYQPGSSFYISVGLKRFMKNGKPLVQDIFAPRRISDLHLEGYINDTLIAILRWTSPGDDLDQGSARTYIIKCFTNEENLHANFSSSGIPIHRSLIPKPDEAGSLQEAKVSLPWANQVFFLAIVAVDKEGNQSPVSNVVSAYIQEVTTTTVMDMTFKVNRNSSHGNTVIHNGLITSGSTDNNDSGMDKRTVVFLVTGAILAFVIVVSVLFCVALYRGKKRSIKASETPKMRAVTISSPIISHHPKITSTGSLISTSSYPDIGEKLVDFWKVSGYADYANVLPVYETGLQQTTNGPLSLPNHPSFDPIIDRDQPLSLGPSPATLLATSHKLYQNLQSLRLGHPHPSSKQSHSELDSPRQSLSPDWDGMGQKSKGSLNQGKRSTSTASTDCSDSDQNSEKNVYNVPNSQVTKEALTVSSSQTRSTQVDTTSMSKSKRQESLV